MSELYHYGVKNQKHGVRRYQYEDGTLTPEGKKHYGIGEGRSKTYTDHDGNTHTIKSEPPDSKVHVKPKSGAEKFRANVKGETATSDAIDAILGRREKPLDTQYGRKKKGNGGNSGGEDKDPIDATLTSTKQISDSLSNTANTLSRNRPINYTKYAEEVADMSDNELRDRVNRMNLENNYARLTDERRNYTKTKGKETVKDILTTAGAVITITGGVIGISKALGFEPTISNIPLGKEKWVV